jgi:hypothetical protein
MQDRGWVAPRKPHRANGLSLPAAACAPAYFFGRVCVVWQRLQRLVRGAIAEPQVGQRRALSFNTNFVRGRVLMAAGVFRAASFGLSRVFQG